MDSNSEACICMFKPSIVNSSVQLNSQWLSLAVSQQLGDSPGSLQLHHKSGWGAGHIISPVCYPFNYTKAVAAIIRKMASPEISSTQVKLITAFPGYVLLGSVLSQKDEIARLYCKFKQTAEENVRLQWVAKVDDYIDGESVNILKLSTRSELTQEQREKINCPSDLYRTLANHYTDSEVQLARFIYALRKLGHRRYGYRAVKELGQSNIPIPFDLTKVSGDQNDFLLHENLAEFCCMLPQDSHASFITYFAKNLLKVNPFIFKSPYEIITKALESNILTPDNHLNILEEALIKINISESKIKVYIENCQRARKLE